MLALVSGRSLILDNSKFEIEREETPINFDLPKLPSYIEIEFDNYIFDYIPVDSM